MTESGNSMRFASFKRSTVSSSDFSRRSMPTILAILSMNHSSIIVASCMRARPTPRRRASAITQILLSSTFSSCICSSSSPRPEKSYDNRESTCCSRERIAFMSAPSKLSQMLITSPVAFIWVVRVRFAVMNLSNGRRGIFTTQ